jgi:hypothetical protein
VGKLNGCVGLYPANYTEEEQLEDEGCVDKTQDEMPPREECRLAQAEIAATTPTTTITAAASTNPNATLTEQASELNTTSCSKHAASSRWSGHLIVFVCLGGLTALHPQLRQAALQLSAAITRIPMHSQPQARLAAASAHIAQPSLRNINYTIKVRGVAARRPPYMI